MRTLIRWIALFLATISASQAFADLDDAFAKEQSMTVTGTISSYVAHKNGVMLFRLNGSSELPSICKNNSHSWLRIAPDNLNLMILATNIDEKTMVKVKADYDPVQLDCNVISIETSFKIRVP